jgi:hypothetical protein
MQMRCIYKILVRKTQGKRMLGKLRHKWRIILQTNMRKRKGC